MKRVQFGGGPTSTVSGFTGRPREILVDTTESTLTVHNGVDAGGRRMLPEDGDASRTMAQATGGTVARLLSDHLGVVVTVQSFGAKGDGATNDSAAFQAAINYCESRGGGCVLAPPTGAAYLLATGITLKNGVALEGQRTNRYAGYGFSTFADFRANWTATGTWLHCTDPTNPGVTLQDSGSAIRGINFIQTQPIPGGTFSPNDYPYVIDVKGNFCSVESIFILNASRGIRHEYQVTHGGGTGCVYRDVLLSCFLKGMYFDYVNDVVRFSNVQVRGMYFPSNAAVVAYQEQNLIGMDIGYLDNPMMNGLQFFNCWAGMYFRNNVSPMLNQTATDGTVHSLYNGLITDAQFGLVRHALITAAANTVVRAQFSNLMAQGDTEKALTDTLFDLTSAKMDLRVSNLEVPSTGGSVLNLGDGAGGFAQIDNLSVLGYSRSTTGKVCLSVNAGARLNIGTKRIVKQSGDGAMISGAGYYNMRGSKLLWQPFDQFGAKSVTGTGAWADLTSDCLTSPYYAGAIQGRITGSVLISTGQTGGTLAVRLSSFPEVAKSGINASAVAWQNFDSGWIDLSSANADIGRVQTNATSGVVAQWGSLTVEFR